MLHNDPDLFEQASTLLLRMMPTRCHGKRAYVLLTADDVAEVDAVRSAIEIPARRRLTTW